MKKLALKIGEEFWLKEGKGIIKIPEFETLGGFVSAFLPNVYILAGIILFILLIFGGLTVIVNAGKDNPEGTAKGQKAISAALIGFLIVFASYWLIQIIETITGIKIFKPEF